MRRYCKISTTAQAQLLINLQNTVHLFVITNHLLQMQTSSCMQVQLMGQLAGPCRQTHSMNRLKQSLARAKPADI